MPNQEKLNWIRLARSENIGTSTFFRLIKIFGSATNAVNCLADYERERGSKKKIKICSEKEVEKELINSAKFGAEILVFSDEKYPALLREIYDPAPVLTIKGNHNFFRKEKLAIVGPRNASLNAISFTKKIASDLGCNNFIVTSGMARGIDSAAHQASLKTGTIAVIAGGINHIYPRENTKLYEEISANGLIVAENSYDSSPKNYSFIQRNRIISGLSIATIVIEAGLRSGSLTTARFALEQGREVFATPGSPLDPRCRGTNLLIKEGAVLIENADDVLGELGNLHGRLTSVTKDEIDGTKLTPISEIILSQLSFVPTAIDDVIEDLQLSTSVVNIALMQLELAEKIEINSGKVVLKTIL